MPLGFLRIIWNLRQLVTMIGTIRNIDRVIVTQCTVTFQELADNPLTILDVPQSLNQIIIITRGCVLKAANTTIHTRWHRQYIQS